jgi:hypothetical protein
MRVIISWSGDSSHEAALELHKGLPQVLAGVEPWISSEDIASGSGWFAELKEALDGADAAIICVTKANLHSEWMHYEAGAVAAKVTKPFVCPYLLNVAPGDLQGLPLQQYQCRPATEDGTLKVIRDINRAFGDGRVPDHLIEGNFRSRWPEFKEKLDGIEYESAEELAVEHPMLREPELSDAAKAILVEGKQDKNGRVFMSSTLDGLSVSTNGKDFVDKSDPRSEAKMRAAVKELARAGFIEDRGAKGEVFALTDAGFEKADKLSKKA